MILLYVTANKTDTTDEYEYNRAAYWILNEETNQTLDEFNIKQAFENEIPELPIEEGEGEGDEP